MLANRQPADRMTIAVGLLLLISGAVTLIAQFVHFELPEDAWPYVIIVPGVAILLTGLLVGREPGLGLTIAGSIVTTVGLVLLYQNTTGRWESWAYAWALVAPTAPGVGLLLSGLLSGDRATIRTGTNMTLIGLALFAVGFVFFEGVIGIGDKKLLDSAVAPALLVVIGLIVVARSVFFSGGSASTGGSGSTGGPPSAPAA